MNKKHNKRRQVTKLEIQRQSCEICGYNEYPIALTLHHIFPKEHFKSQPPFKRRFRYLLVCPTCHHVIHLQIYSDKFLSMVKVILDNCEIEYPDSKKIIDNCRNIYGLK